MAAGATGEGPLCALWATQFTVCLLPVPGAAHSHECPVQRQTAGHGRGANEDTMTAAEQAAYDMRQRCVALLDHMTREWLASAKDLPEEERVGYPPFHFMRVADAIEALPLLALAGPARTETR